MAGTCDKALPRSAPSAQRVDARAISAFVNAISESKDLELHSLMVVRHGHVVAEGWWSPYAAQLPTMLFSLSKSFTSTAIGFAVQEGLVRLDERVIDILREDAPEQPGLYWDEMTVHHLLSMNTGHTIDTTGGFFDDKDGNWVRAFFAQPITAKPGTHFLYNTGATYMLSAIISKRAGMRVLDYLTPRLFAPLGIEGAKWDQCPRGIDTGGFGLNVKTEDIARFGQFLLDRGVYHGVRLLEDAWFDKAFYPHSDNSGGNPNNTSDWGAGYGYQFWKCAPGCWRGDGAFGQYCVVIPDKDAVIAITAGLGDMQAVLTLLWRHLLPGLDAEGCACADDALAAQMKALAYAPLRGDAVGALESDITRKRYAVYANRGGLTALTLCFENDACTLMMETQKGEASIVCGRERYVLADYSCAFDTLLPDGTFKLACSYAWLSPETLLITARCLTGPFVVSMRFTLRDDKFVLERRVNVGFSSGEMNLGGRWA